MGDGRASKENKQSTRIAACCDAGGDILSVLKKKKEVGKGNRRMPWLSKAKKDVISCDKPGGGAHDP